MTDQLRVHAGTPGPARPGPRSGEKPEPDVLTRRAADRLRRDGADGSLAAGLSRALRARHAHRVLADLAGLGHSLLPDLVAALRHADAGARLAAAFTLGYMGRPALPAAPELAAALGDAEADVRWAAAWALVALGPRSARPHLLRALDDADPRVRLAAAEGLGRNGADDPITLTRLARAVEDSDAGVRMAAVRALGAAGPAARVALPALSRALDDLDLGVRGSAADVLARLGAARY
jgi:HEAT repeat protein